MNLALTMLHCLDPIVWAADCFGFKPDPSQAPFLASRHPRIVVNCSRQWGKSTTASLKLMHRAEFRPGSLSIVLSPSGRQSAELLRRVTSLARRLGYDAKGDGENEHSLILPSGSRIIALPGSEKTTRGFSAVSLLVLDEASRIEDTLYRAARPFLAVGGGSLVMMSTPFGKKGFFWDTWESKEDWQRFRVPATECPRIAKSFLNEEREALGDLWFRQEYMCEFLDIEGPLFRREWIDNAITENLKPLF